MKIKNPVDGSLRGGISPNVRRGVYRWNCGPKERFGMTDYRVRAGDIEEDQVTSLIESYSAQVPSSFYLGAAGASIVGSLIAKLQGKDHIALFLGQWAAPFLLLGIYNKMVKQHGSDSITSPE